MWLKRQFPHYIVFKSVCGATAKEITKTEMLPLDDQADPICEWQMVFKQAHTRFTLSQGPFRVKVTDCIHLLHTGNNCNWQFRRRAPSEVPSTPLQGPGHRVLKRAFLTHKDGHWLFTLEKICMQRQGGCSARCGSPQL